MNAKILPALLAAGVLTLAACNHAETAQSQPPAAASSETIANIAASDAPSVSPEQQSDDTGIKQAESSNTPASEAVPPSEPIGEIPASGEAAKDMPVEIGASEEK